jgi:hypothetical protein
MTAPRPVIVGVIDDGIAFAHERFRNSATDSRIEFFWVQDGVSTIPSPVPYGRQFDKAEIDNLLVQCTDAGWLNEDLVYARSGLLDFTRSGHKSVGWRVAHGTHVMDLACGFATPPHIPVPIVCVQLPLRVTADTSGGNLAPFAIDAMGYILRCADQIGGGSLPVVINLSYGIIAGPHDGTSDLEFAMDDLIQQRKAAGLSLEVTLPSGNNFLSRCHAEVSFAAVGASAKLPWRVLPDDFTPSFIEIWMPFRPAGSGPDVEIVITSPSGVSRTIRDVHGDVRNWSVPGGSYADVAYSHMPVTDRGRFVVTVQPTTLLDSTNPTAPAGIWTIEMTNLGLAPTQRINAWVQRDESLYGHPRRGRQSYFDDPAYQRFDHAGREIETDVGNSMVKRFGTINAIATGRNTIVPGGYHRKELKPAKYSGSGALTPPLGQALADPNALVVSEDSMVHSGVLAAGTRSGSVVAMSGTSMAAPQLARWAAHRMANHQPADRAAAKTKAQLDEAGKPNHPSPKRGGAGRMDLDPVYPLPRGG